MAKTSREILKNTSSQMYVTSILPAMLLGLGLPLFAYAEEPEDPITWYQVEVLIFEPTKVELGNEQIYPSVLPPTTPPPNHWLTEESPITDNQHQRLQTEERQLAKIENNLRRSSRYRLLTSLAWQQIITKGNSPYVYQIQTGKRYTDPFQLSDIHHQINGNLTFKKSRYLHLDISLFNQTPTAFQVDTTLNWLYRANANAVNLQTLLLRNSSETEAFALYEQIENTPDADDPLLMDLSGDCSESSQSFETPSLSLNVDWQLSDSRRMRSGETHFIDYPYLGIIVRLDPINPPLTEPFSAIDSVAE